MHVAHGRAVGQPSEQRTATFTGTVHLDPVLATGAVMINTVIFTPGARTYWHSHPGGQLLIVTAGRGIVAARSGEVHVLGTATSSGPSRARSTGTARAPTPC